MPPRNPEAGWRRLFVGRRSPAAAPDAATAGEALPTAVGGRFRLRALLGSGAAGTVYLADDRRTGATVALKLVPLAGDLPLPVRQEWRERATREAVAAARLQHRDIVAVLDAGVEPDLAWLALAYVPGADLSRYTRPGRLLPEPLVLQFGARIARALAHAHRAGIVHRDLKPSNVRIDLARGVLKLTDFGVARVHDAAQTRTGLTLGTPAYMAPESLRGESAGPAADTYALGVLLYELLAGCRPYDASSLGELLRAMARDAPVGLGARRPDLPERVVDAVHHALQRSPGDRPADLDAYADELDRLAGSLPSPLASRPCAPADEFPAHPARVP